MWVVKVGGSLFDSPRLLDWLRELALGLEPIVIVPGGGPFADQVRAAQQRWPIPDPSAHQMALLAMDQFGEMCCALDNRWRRLTNINKLRSAAGRAGKWIWLPSNTNPDVEQSWRVTSDSLAAWLASELRVDGLLIVKSADALGNAPLSANGGTASILDEAFEEYASKLNCPTCVAHRDDYRSWQEMQTDQEKVERWCIRLANK